MYYNIVDNMSRIMADAYSWEEVDGKPRYRWYKMALNSVYMISMLDDKFDIDHLDFKDLKAWYDCTEWVAQNDKEALVYIYADKIPPVTQIVKDKYIAGLANLNYYQSCALAKKHLRSYPVPEERTLARKKAKTAKRIEDDLIYHLKFCDGFLSDLKRDHSDKLQDIDQDFAENLAALLTLRYKIYGDRLDRSLAELVWMHENFPNELAEMFSFELCQEIKDQFLDLLSEFELFRIRNFMDKNLILKDSPFYFEIPPCTKLPEDDMNQFFDTNEEDDDDD